MTNPYEQNPSNDDPFGKQENQSGYPYNSGYDQSPNQGQSRDMAAIRATQTTPTQTSPQVTARSWGRATSRAWATPHRTTGCGPRF